MKYLKNFGLMKDKSNSELSNMMWMETPLRINCMRWLDDGWHSVGA